MRAPLGKLCAVYGLTMSRLMRMVEDDFAPLVCRAAQPVWTDDTIGFIRRSVSPPARLGRLDVGIDGKLYALGAGDCLRYQLFGKSSISTPKDSGARYVLFMV